jgi:hypothetical protein
MPCKTVTTVLVDTLALCHAHERSVVGWNRERAGEEPRKKLVSGKSVPLFCSMKLE